MRDLAAALAADDAAEDRGMHADDRRTCWQCQSWADHAHHPATNARMTLDQWAAYTAARPAIYGPR
jgi:hypothetical protein